MPRMRNKAKNSMDTIGSLLEIPNNIHQYEFLVEKLLVPYFKVSEYEFVCEIIGPSDPWYQKIFTYLKRGILPNNITSNLKKTFVNK
jgi:hypothetical protein